MYVCIVEYTVKGLNPTEAKNTSRATKNIIVLEATVPMPTPDFLIAGGEIECCWMNIYLGKLLTAKHSILANDAGGGRTPRHTTVPATL